MKKKSIKHCGSETVGAYFKRRRLSTLGYKEDLTTPLDEALRRPAFLTRLARHGLLNHELMHRILHDEGALAALRAAFDNKPSYNEPSSTSRAIYYRPELPDYIEGPERAKCLRLCPVVYVSNAIDDAELMQDFRMRAPIMYGEAAAMFDAQEAEDLLRYLRLLDDDPSFNPAEPPAPGTILDCQLRLPGALPRKDGYRPAVVDS